MLLQIEVNVSVVIAFRFIIDGRINQAESFPYRSHQVGRLLDSPVLVECPIQAIACRFIILDLPVAFCQCAVCSCRLVNVSIFRKDIECALRKIACQKFQRHLFYIEILESRQIVFYQEITLFRILDMFADRLQCVCLPVGIRGIATCHEIEANEHIKFSLTDFLWGAMSNGATRSHIIKIVEILCRILFQFIRVKICQRIEHRLV